MKVEQGVCVVLPTLNKIEEVFAISRRDSVIQFGLPGGKVDPGESNLEAVVREIDEECMLHLRPHLLVPLYVGWCYGADGRDFWTTAYLYTGNINDAVEPGEKGFIIKKMDMMTLCNELHSPFAPYNRQVISAWRAYK